MRLLLPVLAVILVMAGCSSSGERAYYQTRYIPSSGDALYSASERSRWRGDHEVYELPGKAPALGEAHRARRDCVRPGSGFPVDGKVAYHDDVRGGSQVALQDAGGYDSRPDVGDGPLTKDPENIAAMGDVRPMGLPQRNFHTQSGAYDSRAQRGAGPTTGDAQAIGRARDQDKWNYCLEPHTEPVDRERGKAAAPAAGQP